ncbi:DUF4347 domain-containing protein [Pseudomonas rubra]|uniref:DUF4347 domain-containing protein n=1 Tax=Pseudomonas rubra TaxID=2942627 RepID=A0ABT5P3P6_9PSED|nr:DUF4347 domain-containing protein [Pseudomonas rubra]MDD1012709.1 DUF4347 domain-containing protein [Pseudomonas rubra]MDD1041583.1 DUF4347 domain-containing protein [Pseudomonas rubra]MDD1155519.1 DUF4347 domain-containing protein [Pseudomonas rubra]
MKFIERFLRQLAQQPQTSASSQAPLLMALEPRIMFDASVGAVAQESVVQADAEPAKDSTSAVETSKIPAASADSRGQQGAQRQDVVFVDGQVGKVGELLDGLSGHAEVVILDPSKDGLQQMADYLKGREGLDAVHLLSHGAAGTVQVGELWLNSSNLVEHRAALETIGSALKADGDLMLYGCRVGDDNSGKAFIDNLASITGADIAASTDDTGAQALGGNWSLEVSNGVIETHALGNELSGYKGLMAASFTGGPNPTAPTLVTLPKMVVGDFNNDGRDDILYQTSGAASAWKFAAGNSDGTFTIVDQAFSPFSNVSLIDATATSTNYYTADFDGDGDIDVLASLNTGPGTTLYRNDNGVFSAEQVTSITGALRGVRMVVGDFNGDRAADILYQTGDNSSPWKYALNSGNGTFTEMDLSASPFNGLTFSDYSQINYRVIDFDGDGDLDILYFLNGTSGKYYRNDGSNFTMGSTTGFPSPAFGPRVLVGDFDGDGDADFFYQQGANGTEWSYAENLGNQTFDVRARASSPFAGLSMVDFSSFNFRTGDFDGDGDLDVVASKASTPATVFYQSGSPPTLVSATPADDSLSVSPSANIVLTFNESVSKGTGNIYIVRTSDGAVVQTIAVGSAAVTGSGTTWTINPPTDLAQGTAYAVRYDKQAFADADGVVSKGIYDNTTLNFTTLSNAAPVISGLNGDSVTYTEDGGAVILDAGGNATVTDVDSAHFNGGTVTVAITANNIAGDDVLSLHNQGTGAGQIGLSGSNVTYAGVLIGTLSGGSAGANLVISLNASANAAAVSALLQNLTYRNSNGVDTGSLARTVEIRITDGSGGTSIASGVNVSIVPVNDAPTASATGGTPTFTEGGAPVDLFSGVTLSTVEAGQSVKQLTFTVSNVINIGNERLTIDGTNVDLINGNAGTTSVNGLAFTVSLSGSLATVTLSKVGGISTGTAQTLIDGMTYSHLSHSPDTSSRTVTLTSISDTGGTSNGGVDTTSLAISATVAVVAINDAPLLSGGPFVLPGTNEDTVSTGQLVSTILAGLSHNDVDAGALSGIALTASSGNGIWQYSTDGTTWNNVGTVSSVSSLLLSSTAYVRFHPDGFNSGSASLSFRAWDQTSGSASSNAVRNFADTTSSGGTSSFSVGIAQAQITVTAVNDAPNLTPVGPVLGGITDGQVNNAGQTVGSFLSGVTDVDTGALSGIAITGASNGSGIWQFSTDGTSWNDIGSVAGDSALLLRSTDRVRLVPDGATSTVATLTYKAWDQTGASAGQQGSKVDTSVAGGSSAFSTSTDTASITVTATNDAPSVVTSGGSATFIEGNNVSSTPVVVDSGLTLSDTDNITLSSATVSITGNLHTGEDILAFTGNPATTGNISASYNTATGVLTLTSAGGTATLLQWQEALRSVIYSNASDSPNTASRTLSFVVNDGSLDSLAATRVVTVTATNDAPVLGTSAGSTSYVESTAPVRVDNGLSLSDLDSATLTSATVAITGNFHSVQDRLGFLNNPATMGNISASYNTATGELTLTSAGAIATLAQWQAALRSVEYSNSSSNPDTGARTLSFTVNDGHDVSNIATKVVNVVAVNDAPVILAPGSITVIEDTTTALTGIVFSDADAGSSPVTVTLSVPAGLLHGTSGAGVLVSGSGTGTLVLVGSLSDINTLIGTGSLTYTPAANATANVTLSMNIDDGGHSGTGGAQSGNSTLTLMVTAVNDAPVNQLPTGQIVNQDGTLTFNSSNGNLISISDVDAGSNSLQVTLLVTHGTLTLSAVSGLSFIVGSGSGDTTMTFVGSLGSINAALNGMSFTPIAGYNGAASLQVISNDQGSSGTGGALTDSDTLAITVAALNPRVINVDAPLMNGGFKVGDSIYIVLTFDQAVFLSADTPTLLLETGAVDRTATYYSGSGSNALVFKYTVQAGDQSADLDYTSSAALSLNGTTLRSASQQDALLTLPTAGSAHSLGANNNIVIDGIEPVISSVTVPGNGTYVAGQNLDFTLNLSEAVTVAGAPRLEIVLDTGGTVYADYVSGSGTSALVFRLSVTSGQLDSNGISVGSSLDLNGGAVRDSIGNNLDTRLNNVASTIGVRVDGVAPQPGTLVAIDSNPTNAGSVRYTVTFSEAVNGVDTSDFTLVFTGSVSGSIASVVAVDARTYTVLINGLTGDGTLGLNLNDSGTDITDAAGNILAAGLTGTLYSIDRVAPSIGSIDVPAAGAYNAGDVLRFTVNTSEVVNVTFAPWIIVNIGGRDVTARYVSGTGSNALVFEYQVQVNDNTTLIAGVQVVAVMAMPSFHDQANNAMDLTLNNVGSTAGIVVDTVDPRVSAITPLTPGPSNASNATFSVSFNEDVSNVSVEDFTLLVGGNVQGRILSITALDARNYRVEVGELTGTGDIRVAIASARDIIDVAGNSVAAGTQSAALQIDRTVPTVTDVQVPAAGSYKAGELLRFTVSASEPVIVDTRDGTPGLLLNIGGSNRYATYVSGSGTGQLVFQYSVQQGNNDADGIQLGSSLALNGGAIRDAAGNDLNLSLNGVHSTASVRVDTQAPLATEIVRVDVNPTNSSSVRYTVRFDEGVSGVDMADFSLIYTGSAAGRISSVAQVDDRTYTVLVESLSGVGSVRLDLKGVGTGIIDAAGNAIGGGIEGSAYSIDRVAPKVTGVEVPAAGSYVAGQGLDFTVRLDEVVLVGPGPGLPRLSVTLDNGQVAYADYVSGSGSDTLVFRLVISPGQQASNGLRLSTGIDLQGGTLQDVRGNDVQTALSNVGSTTGISVDTRAPQPVQIVLDGPAVTQDKTLSYTLTFDEPVSAVDVTDFSLHGGASGVVQSVLQLDERTYRVTVANVSGQGSLGLSLNAQGSGIRDAAGNALTLSLSSASYQILSQDVGDLEYRTNPPVNSGSPSSPLLQPQVPPVPAIPTASPLVPSGLFEHETLGSGIDTLGNIFINNGISAPSYIAQVFASSDQGASSAGGIGFAGGEGGVFGSSTLASLFARQAVQEGESMRVFDGKQWRTTDPAQGLRAVFGAASLEQQLQNIKDAEQRPVRELAMALSQPTQIGNRA